MKMSRLLATLLLAAAAVYGQTVQDAKKFLDDAEKRLFDLSLGGNQAQWVQSTYITDDTEAVAAQANERAIAEAVRLAKGAVRFDKLKLPPDMARKMMLLKNGLTLAAPANPAESAEVTRLAASLEGTYGKGKYCPDLGKAEAVPGHRSHHARSWRTAQIRRSCWMRGGAGTTISPPMRKDFTRFVELSNKGARELGFKDTGAMWRSKYDMPPDDFAKELDRLWEQVRPLYVSLHAYVRRKLREKYGDVVPGERSDSGASAGQHLGAGLDQRL